MALDSERTAEERNKLGQFATPPDLANDMARVALAYLGEQSVRFLEPSIGSGAFYSALLAACPRTRIESAVGFELDPRFVEAARTLWSDLGLCVTPGDFTASSPPTADGSRATLVLANPPYVRHHHLERERKALLQARASKSLGGKVSGLTGLYVYFIILAHEWMADGGIAAWLVPTEWMDVNYGAALKEYLCTKVQLLRVHRFDAATVQFGDALVSSSIIVFRRGSPEPDCACELTVGDLTEPLRTNAVQVGELRHALKWSHYFSAPNGHAYVAPSPATVTLGDLIAVKRGIATGDNHFFIRPRAEFAKLGIPDRFLRPIVPSSRHLPHDVIGRSLDGYPALPVPLALLDCDAPEAEIKRDYPRLWEYLESDEGQRARTGYLTSGRRPWYSQERRAVAPVLATYMGRGRKGQPPFRFFWNQSDATATNVYLLLIPKPGLAAVLERDPGCARLIVDFLVHTDPAELLGHGRVYGGGLHKLEPKELGRLDASKLVQRLGLSPRVGGAQTRLGFRLGT